MTTLPGDVALVAEEGRNPVVAIRDDEGNWRSAFGKSGRRHIALERRLVVIDPEDEEAAFRLINLYWSGGADRCNAKPMQRALRDYANSEMPEPIDPTACVTDRRDNIWRLLADGDWVCVCGPDHGEYIAWSRLAADRGPLTVEVTP